MFNDFMRPNVRQPARPETPMGPDFAAAPAPLMQPSTLIDSVMAQHPQGGGGGGGMQSALSGLGTAIGTKLGGGGLGPAAPDHAQPDTTLPEMPHSGVPLSFGGLGGEHSSFMPRKRPPFQGLGIPLDGLDGAEAAFA